MCTKYTNAGFAFILLLLTTTLKLFAGAFDGQTVKQPLLHQSPIYFIENKGQVKDQYNNKRPDINFKLSCGAVNVFIGKGSLHYEWLRQNKDTSAKVSPFTDIYRMDVSLSGANKNAEWATENEQQYEEHYYPPDNADGITTHSFQKIIYKNIYSHIDWVLYVKDNKLKYEFIVHPGGDPKQIKIKYEGTTTQELKDGTFVAYTPLGNISEQHPFCFEQETTKTISSKFSLRNNILGFDLAPYNGTLIIDPFINWVTYYGGTSYDYPLSCAADAAGNVVMAGRTQSITNIASTGAFQTSCAGSDDGMLVKFDKAGIRQWATYFGGTGADIFTSVDIGAYGNIYVAALPGGAGLATTGAYQTTFGGNTDILVAKFSGNGARIWSTYYGGNSGDEQGMIKCDRHENIYVLGNTSSTNNIASPGSFHPNIFPGDPWDVFLVKFDNSGVRQWATYAGGPGNDYAGGIACDTLDNVYIGGHTTSTTDIATPAGHQLTYGGSIWDAFLMKFNGTGTQLWGTYFGGGGNDNIVDIACDDTGNVYIGGNTQSTNNIATPGTYKEVSSNANENFIAKFTTGGTQLWGTYYGEAFTQLNSIGVNAYGDIFFCGYTTSAANIATPAAYQTTLNGGQDAILVQLNNSGTAIPWATYLGGNATETTSDCALSSAGYIYVTGYTISNAQFATPDVYQGTLQGNGDAFLAAFTDRDVFILQPFTDTAFCAADIFNLNYSVNFDFNAGNIFSVQLSDQNGSFANPTVIGSKGAVGAGAINCVIPAGLPASKGYRIRIVASDPYHKSKDDGINIEIKRTPNFTALSNSPVCIGDQLKLIAVSVTPGLSFSWVGPLGFNSTLANPVINNVQPVHAGNYLVTATDAGCNATSTIIVIVASIPVAPAITTNSPVCENDTILLTASALVQGLNFNWTGPGGFSSILQNPSVDPVSLIEAGVYCATVTTANGCTSLPVCDTVVVYPEPIAPFVADTNICQYINKPVLNVTGTNLAWYIDTGVTHATQPDLNTLVLGKQTIYITQSENGCESDKATMNINITGTPVFDLGDDRIICRQQQLVIGKSQENVTYSWNIGSAECCIVPVETGAYVENMTNNCGTTSDTLLLSVTECDSCLFVPSAFTPNNDGKNDLFGAVMKCPLKAYTLSIYSRWGELIFHTDDPQIKWDGLDKGEIGEVGVYYYYITYRPALFESEEFLIKGDVVLVR